MHQQQQTTQQPDASTEGRISYVVNGIDDILYTYLKELTTQQSDALIEGRISDLARIEERLLGQVYEPTQSSSIPGGIEQICADVKELAFYVVERARSEAGPGDGYSA